MTRETANLFLMFGIVFVTGAAIMLPLGIALIFIGASASIGFIIVGIVIGVGGAWMLVNGRRALRHLNSIEPHA